jgi:hypothetical protein
MIMTVEELRKFIKSDDSDECLEAKLAGIEQQIRHFTNNNFQVRGTGRICDVVGGTFTMEALNPYEVGDTVQISGSAKNDGLYTVSEVNEFLFTVNEKTRDEIDVFVTLVRYPADIKMGVLNLMTWELENRQKAGIESETISRHTVNYINLDAWNSNMGYPASLTHFLKPYMKARFGRGIGG